jgi:choline monooxygenase
LHRVQAQLRRINRPMARTLAEEIERFDAKLPLARARTIPSQWYRDPRIADLEQSSVFGNSWQLVARGDQLAEPGSFITANIAGEPVLVVRDDAGVLRAFFNVCRHRAACVVTEPEGKASRLRCRYHGWTYDLAGRLRGAPEFDQVADFRRDETGLVQVAVDTWGPLVFVHLGHSPQRLSRALAPLPGRVGAVDAFRSVERRSYELGCNWKVFVDNYLDGGYHVNTVHPSLAGVLQYAQYKTECFASTSLQTSPLRVPDPQNVGASASAVRSGETAFYGWAFPNFMINVYAGAMDTNVVLPMGPERCSVQIDFYVSEPDGPGGQCFSAESVDVGHQIQLEDVGVCEDVQRGLGSKSYDTGRYSVRREAGVHHFHKLLAKQFCEREGEPAVVKVPRTKAKPGSAAKSKSRSVREDPPRTRPKK